MKILKAELTAVAVKNNQYPPEDRPEIEFAGRSNVGKSSLLNMLVNRKKLARVSGSPGKTQTINFYDINDAFRIVDLPGYGYAKVSKSKSSEWGPMIENYLRDRKNLLRVIQLVDVRHAPSAQDVQMYGFLKYYNLDGTVVATKSDKLSKNEVSKNLRMIKEKLEMSPGGIIIPISSLKKTGGDSLLEHISDLIDAEERD